MGSDYIGYILAFVVGAAVPILLNWLERKDKYKFVAIETRLDAHQKAYYQCMEFFKAMDSNDDKKIKEIFLNGKDFFANYSLYLGDSIREKYVEALGFVNAFCPKQTYLKEFLPEQRKEALIRFHNESKKVFELARIIQEEVQLEPLDMRFKNQ